MQDPASNLTRLDSSDSFQGWLQDHFNVSDQELQTVYAKTPYQEDAFQQWSTAELAAMLDADGLELLDSSHSSSIPHDVSVIYTIASVNMLYCLLHHGIILLGSDNRRAPRFQQQPPPWVLAIQHFWNRRCSSGMRPP